MATFLLALNAYAIRQNLFVQIWWLDILFHAAGGTWLVFLFLILAARPTFYGVIIFSLTVSILWEILEFNIHTAYFGLNSPRLDDPLWMLDTAGDLIIDMLAVVLAWFAARTYNKSNV